MIDLSSPPPATVRPLNRHYRALAVAVFSLFITLLAAGDAQAVNTITLSLPISIAEGGSGQGTVTLNSAAPSNLMVALSTTDPRLSLPASVTVLTGQTSVNFTASYPNDALIDDNAMLASATASASGWTGGNAQVTMVDDEPHDLQIFSLPVTVAEGSTSGFGFDVFVPARVRNDLTLTMINSDPSEVAQPASATLTIPAGQDRTSSGYDIGAVDDSLKDGAQLVTITATAAGFTSAALQVTVRDNDPAVLSWPAIASPVTAGVALSADLRAYTIDGDPVALNAPVMISAVTNGQSVTVFPASLDSLSATGTTKFWLTKAGTTVLTATSGDITGNSDVFTVAPASLGSFEWSSVPSPILPATAAPVVLMAKDAFGNALSSFTGTASLSAFAEERTDAVGTGTGYGSEVIDPVVSRARSQILVHAGALGGAGRIYNVSLQLLNVPTRPYDDLTIRLKHTSQVFAPSAWDGSGWTVVRQGAWLPAGSAWVTIPFQVPFDYDGTSNLYVDVSFVNDSPSGHVFCQGTGTSGFYAYYAGTNDPGAGLPTTWSGTNVAASIYFRPNLKLGFGSTLAITPATTPSFAAGAWSGNVTLSGATPARVVLQASSGIAAGVSATTDFGLVAPDAPVFSTEPDVTVGTSNQVSWSTIANAGKYWIECDEDSGFGSPENSGWISGTSFTFTGLADGTTYYYRVKARRADDISIESGWSNVANSTQDDSGPSVSFDGAAVTGVIRTMRDVVHVSGMAWDYPSYQVDSITIDGQMPAVSPASGFPGTIAWEIDLMMPASGSVSVPIVATDSLGNMSFSTLTLTRVPDANGDNLPDDWQQSGGLFGPGITAAQAGPNGDPDHDGLTNLMEYALGRQPLVYDASPFTYKYPATFPLILPQSLFEYDRRIEAIDVTFAVKSSLDLTSWDAAGGNATITPNLDGVTEHVSISVPEGSFIFVGGPGGGTIIVTPPPPRKFYRLLVSPAP